MPVGKEGEPPHLVFASDQPTGELESMLAEPGVVADLIDLKAGIALALPNLTVDAASLVRQLNRDGIPVTAWLTVPTEQGYYLNASNGRQAEVRFEDFEKWTTANGLRWAAIGLDIEPNIQDFATLRQASKWRLFFTLLGRYVNVRRVRDAKYIGDHPTRTQRESNKSRRIGKMLATITNPFGPCA